MAREITTNKRIFWAVQALMIAGDCGIKTAELDSCDFVHGVQSVGITTTFNLEQVFELGKLELYENIETLPDIEVTAEKVLDGRNLLYTKGSPSSNLVGHSLGAGNPVGLVTGANDRTDMVLAIYDDTASFAGGEPINEWVYMSGMYVSSVSYTLPVDGNMTESVTFVGNHKVWKEGPDIEDTPLLKEGGDHDLDEDDPVLGTEGHPSDGVQRRENLKLESCIFPSDMDGVVGNAVGNALSNVTDPTSIRPHMQSITISADLGRDAIFELGRKGPYHRYVTFPLEITCDIEVISEIGDRINAREEGLSVDTVGGTNPDGGAGATDERVNGQTVKAGNNLADQRIYIVLDDETAFDLGTKNKLSSVTYTGGDTGGGNVSVTYSYSNFNSFTVTDPCGANNILNWDCDTTVN
tara:strand:+ start:2474 stop:3703 length:1230 start_codon:yes stop_codon:yes gene_type:complete